MFRDKKLTITIIVVLLISVIGLGIAFAAFSQTLTINGTGTVESSSWSVVFEGADGSNTIGAPTLTGTAAEVTHPTIKNNSTEISTYEVSLKTPGDSVTYNFKIHNKGDYAADLSSLRVAKVDWPTGYVNYADLVTTERWNSGVYKNGAATSVTNYGFLYTADNTFVGQNSARDCLEPGESENVTLKITFSTSNASDTRILPKEDIVLDNLGISATYNQKNNGTCSIPRINNYSGNFINIDKAYYTYEGKSFIGTPVDNVIVTETIIGRVVYASAATSVCSDGSTPAKQNGGYYVTCPADTTPTFNDSPAKDMAEAYCTGCRLLTKAEVQSWHCPESYVSNSKCAAKYNNSYSGYWLADGLVSEGQSRVWIVDIDGVLYNGGRPFDESGVRPVVDIPSTATMTGSGTKASPYVITTSN